MRQYEKKKFITLESRLCAKINAKISQQPLQFFLSIEHSSNILDNPCFYIQHAHCFSISLYHNHVTIFTLFKFNDQIDPMSIKTKEKILNS